MNDLSTRPRQLSAMAINGFEGSATKLRGQSEMTFTVSYNKAVCLSFPHSISTYLLVLSLPVGDGAVEVVSRVPSERLQMFLGFRTLEPALLDVERLAPIFARPLTHLRVDREKQLC